MVSASVIIIIIIIIIIIKRQFIRRSNMARVTTRAQIHGLLLIYRSEKDGRPS